MKGAAGVKDEPTPVRQPADARDARVDVPTQDDCHVRRHAPIPPDPTALHCIANTHCRAHAHSRGPREDTQLQVRPHECAPMRLTMS